MKNFLKICLCFALAFVMAFGTSLNVYAANTNNEYISEVITFKADSYENAKKGLENLGYKIAGNVNLNATLKSGIYLGYKTTKNKDEAITDLAVMNMTGNYSYTDYETILEKQRDAIADGINALLPAILNYQDALAAGTNEGKLAKELLNEYKDEDSGKLMGDYFAEYDFSEDNLSNFTEVLLQANSGIVLNMMNALAITADEEDTTLLERLSKIGLDGAFDAFKKSYIGKNAERRFRTEYSETVAVLLDDWDNIVNALEKASKYVTKNDDGNYVIVESEEGYDVSLENILLYLQIKSLGDEEIENLFLSHYDKEMYDALYAVAFVMTEAQRGLLTYLSPLAIMTSDATSYNAITKESFDEITANLDVINAISIYEGIDRTIYDEGVAFTSAATVHESLSGTPWYASSEANNIYYKVMIYSAVASAVSGAIGIASYAIGKNLQKSFDTSLARMTVETVVEEDGELVVLETFGDPAEAEKYSAKMTSRIRFAKIIACVAFVLCIVFLVLDIISIIAYFTTKGVVYEEQIPSHLVTAVELKNSTEYVYYTACKNQDGKEADLNNHEGDPSVGWLVLYYTKDENAGKPILADSFKMQQGTNIVPTGYVSIHLFNETAPANLTAENYTSVADSANGTYVFYKVETTQLNTAVGSAYTSPTQTIIVGLASIIIGVLLGTIISKKRKEANA